jgi:hypothetical protein
MGEEANRPYNQLTKQQRCQLWMELAGMKEEIDAARMSAAMVLPVVAAKLGFRVTENNLQDAAQATGVKLYRRMLNRPLPSDALKQIVDRVETLGTRVQNLAEVTAAQRDRVSILETRLSELRGAVLRLEQILEGLTAPSAAPAAGECFTVPNVRR